MARCRTRPLGALAASLLLAAGCGGAGGLFGSPSNAPPQTVTVSHERAAERVLFLNRCPVTDPGGPFSALVAPLVSALAPLAANVLVAGIKAYIERARNNLTATYVASGSVPLFDRSGALLPRCLVLARGVFGTRGPGQPLGDARGSLEPVDLDEVGLADYPDFYLEARLSPHPPLTDGTIPAFSMVVEPRLLHFARTAAKRSDADAKFIAILLVFTEGAPAPGAGAEAAASTAVATAAFDFHAIRQGTEYRTHPDATIPLRNPLYDQRRAVLFAKPGEEGPAGSLNIYAFVTETETPSPLYDLAINSIAAKEEDLEKAVADFLNGVVARARTGEGNP